MKLIIYCISIVLVSAQLSWGATPYDTKSPKYVKDCFDYLAKNLKDPYSAKIAEYEWKDFPHKKQEIDKGIFIDAFENTSELHIKYRAKNSYGAYELGTGSCVFRIEKSRYNLEQGLTEIRGIERENIKISKRIKDLEKKQNQ